MKYSTFPFKTIHKSMHFTYMSGVQGMGHFCLLGAIIFIKFIPTQRIEIIRNGTLFQGWGTFQIKFYFLAMIGQCIMQVENTLQMVFF